MVDDDTDDHLDADLDRVLVGGREPREIVLAEPDPARPARYEQHRAVLGAALAGWARRIDHVGSTAVPGLAANPVVDVHVTVADPEDEALVPLLEGAGDEPRVREPGHRLFRTPERTVHVHLWRAGSSDERRHVLFRDWLRRHEGDRRRYEATKRRLAARRWRDTNDDAEAKGPVIAAIMERAERWAAREGWRLPSRGTEALTAPPTGLRWACAGPRACGGPPGASAPGW
ncbi:MAG TPA: GrpB family protein [Acidimicrobiales bacterium]|nr:GrpB family protein [Acidimicrobiales bacterium]